MRERDYTSKCFCPYTTSLIKLSRCTSSSSVQVVLPARGSFLKVLPALQAHRVLEVLSVSNRPISLLETHRLEHPIKVESPLPSRTRGAATD